MKQRYNIIEKYNGLFDNENIIATTEKLFDAIKMIKLLKRGEQNPCYSYDFKKIANDTDEALDWIPGEGLLDEGKVIDCKNYKEYLEKIEEIKNQAKEKYYNAI